MIKNLIPEVVLREFDINFIEYIRPAKNAWASSKCFEIKGSMKHFILKKWRGEFDFEKLKREVFFLKKLGDLNFKNIICPLISKYKNYWVQSEKNTFWSAYNFIPGTTLLEVNLSSASIAGKLLGNYHLAGRKIICEYSESRLYELVCLVDILEEGLDFSLKERFEIKRILKSFINKDFWDNANLPVAVIHGDFNLDNIIEFQKDYFLIDFEFTRPDFRILDFSELIVPKRDKSGKFIFSNRAFVNKVLDSYNETAGEEFALSREEKKLIPLITLLHFLLILKDLMIFKSDFILTVCQTIKELLDFYRKELISIM